MKKPLIIFIYLLLAQLSIAQRNGVNDYDRENFFRMGLKAGVNANKIPGASYKQGNNFNYQFGTFMQFNFSKRFGVQPEVNFLQSSYSYATDANQIVNDLFRDGTQKAATFNYMQIPILLNMNVGVSRHIKLQAGPAIGFFIKHKTNTNAEGKEELSMYKNGELSAVGGLWIQLPFINFGGRYQLGLSNVYHPDVQRSSKNQSIQVFIGFTI